MVVVIGLILEFLESITKTLIQELISSFILFLLFARKLVIDGFFERILKVRMDVERV
jgi:hypothetical protein